MSAGRGAGYHPGMRRIPAATLLAVALAACNPSGNLPTATVGTAAPTTPSPRPQPTLDIEQPGLTPGVGQTDTEWGPIWEDVPAGFPAPPGGQPAEADTGPVSAAWTVPAAALPNPRAVAQRYVDAFAAAGYGGGRDGPLEDGSYTAWASNGYGCDILVTALPRGEETLATVLYGAGCPFSWAAE